MATIALQEAESKKTWHGGPAIVVTRPEAAGQSFKRGEFVYLSGGKVTLAAVTQNTFLGMALHDASGTTDTPVQIALATADTVFSANLTTGQTTAVADVGKSYGFAIVSARWHLSNAIVGANARALIVDLDDRDVVGDTQGRLLFILLGKFRQIDVTS
jgi:hypothetical protein